MARRELVEWTLEVDASGAVQGLESAADRAKRLASEAARVDRGFDSIGKGGQKLAAMLGGPFADLGDIVFDLGEAAHGSAGAIGVMGGAALGAVVGVAALTYAGVQLAASADEAAKRLEEAGLAALIPPESQASVDRYRDATAALRTEADLLTVQLGGPALDAVSAMAEMLSGAAVRAGELADMLSSVASALPERPAWVDTLQRVGLGIATGGASEAIRGVSALAESLQVTGRQAGEARRELTELAREDAAAEDTTLRLAKARDEAAKAADRERQAAARLADQTAAATDAVLDQLVTLSGTFRDVARELPRLMLTPLEQLTASLESVRPLDFSSIDYSATEAAIGSGLSSVRRDRIASGIGAVAQVAEGGVSGVSSLLAAAGPIGAAISAGINLGPIVDGLGGLVDSVIDVVTDLPEILSTLLTEVVPEILGSIPELVTAIIETVGDLPAILIEAIPEIIGSLLSLLIELPQILTTSLLDLLQDLPQMIVDGTRQLVSDLWAQLQGLPELIWEGVKGLFGLGDRQLLGTDLTAAKGERSLFGISFDSGSREITRTGMAMLHRGEEVTRKAYRGAGRAQPATINVYGPDTREIVRQVSALLGGQYGPSYGTGDTL